MVGPYLDGRWTAKRAAVRIGTLEFRGDLGGLGTEIDRAEVHLGPGKARKTQQIVDERRHMFAGGDDSLRIAPAILAENLAVIFQQGGAETAHRPERGAQVVGDRVVKLSRLPWAALRSSARRRTSAAARACFCSVTSRAIDDAPISPPASSWMGETVTDAGKSVPSLRRRKVS